MESRSLGILLPSAYRPHALIQCLVSLLTEDHAPATIVVSLVEDDEASPLVLQDLPVQILTRSRDEYQCGAVYAWNQCLRAAPDCDLYVLAADDLIFRRHWLNWTLYELDRLGGSGLVGFNDLSSDGSFAAHWLADRQFLIEHNGGVMYPPMYRSWWADREISEIAQATGHYVWARSAVVEHFNYTFGKSPIDRTYREAMVNYEADRALYQARKAEGFPRTWKPILVE